MTNEEVVEKVNNLFDDKMFWDDSIESYNFELTKKHILDLIEENTKFKAEIEQLKSELEQSDSCDGCKHNIDRNEYYCDGCKRIAVDNFETKGATNE